MTASTRSSPPAPGATDAGGAAGQVEEETATSPAGAAGAAGTTGAPGTAAGSPRPGARDPDRRERGIQAQVIDILARAVHALHGSRGLLVAVPFLLGLSLIEPLLPPEVRTTLLTAPLMLLVASALATLPREAAAAQHVVRDLSADGLSVGRVARRIAWPTVLIILLLPRLFLGAVGIPHLNPLTGLVLPSITQSLATAFLFLLLVVPVLYLRGLRHYSPAGTGAVRPIHLPPEHPEHRARDALLVLTWVAGIFWAWLLRPFWQPFSLLAWPPGLASLESVRGVASLTYTLVLPLVLLQTMAIHLDLIRDIREAGTLGQHRGLVAAAVGHVLLALGAMALHAYDVLWVVRYQAASGL